MNRRNVFKTLTAGLAALVVAPGKLLSRSSEEKGAIIIYEPPSNYEALYRVAYDPADPSGDIQSFPTEAELWLSYEEIVKKYAGNFTPSDLRKLSPEHLFGRNKYMIIYSKNKSEVNDAFVYNRVEDEFTWVSESSFDGIMDQAIAEDVLIITPLGLYGCSPFMVKAWDKRYENTLMSANELGGYLDPDVCNEHFGIKENDIEYEDKTVEWALSHKLPLVMHWSDHFYGTFTSYYWPLLDGPLEKTVMTTMVILREVVKSYNADSYDMPGM